MWTTTVRRDAPLKLLFLRNIFIVHNKLVKVSEPPFLIFFFPKENLCTCSKHIAPFFSAFFLTNPAILKTSKLAKNEAAFLQDGVRRGGSLVN